MKYDYQLTCIEIRLIDAKSCQYVFKNENDLSPDQRITWTNKPGVWEVGKSYKASVDGKE